MKRTLLLGLMLLGGITAQAQLQAPDFTVTDINGTEHVLADYLAEGKTVLVDVSATWCGPCWSFHNMHTLEKIYESYGPGGSNEVVVLFVEGDSNTPTNNLYGENGPGTPVGYPTQGDWVTGTPYPIIESYDLAVDLDLNLSDGLAFPSLYRICPDGTYTQIPNTQFAIQNIINSMNTCNTLEGVNDHAKVEASIDSATMRVCQENDNAAPTVTLTNYGNNAITTAVLNLKNSDGNIIATKNYEGNLAKYATTNITFDETAVEFGDYTIEVEGINENDPFTLSSTDVEVELAIDTNRNIVLKIYTDNYPGEISWAIKDSNGTVIAEEEYAAGPGQAGAGGPDANTTKVHNITLPEGVDCYTIEANDSYGDGWSFGSTEHGLEIFDHTGETSIHRIDLRSDFFETLVFDNIIKSNGTLNNEVFETGKFAVYPNPTNGILNFTTQEPVNVTILDLTGKVVFTAKAINDGQSVNLSSLQSGMYIAKINSQNAERIEKIVIK